MPEKNADTPKTAAPKVEEVTISFDATRNGDRLGHDHLDFATIHVADYTISIDKDRIGIQLPARVPNHSGIGFGSYYEKFTLIEETQIDHYGQVHRIFRFKK